MAKTIGAFLRALIYEEPGVIRGGFEGNRRRIFPQVVPPSLLDFCRLGGRELAAVRCSGDLSVAFVVDEPERYSYIHQRIVGKWGVGEAALLQAALSNLRAVIQGEPLVKQFGSGDRLSLVWESFDGYDASRILLTSELVQTAMLVTGNPVIAIPHRDYMVMFGDASAAYVMEMTERVRGAFEEHNYPITPRLFTLINGNLEVYQGASVHGRILN